MIWKSLARGEASLAGILINNLWLVSLWVIQMYADEIVVKELRLAQKRFEEAQEAFETLKETIEVLSDKKLLKGIRTSQMDFKAGRFRNIRELET